MPAACFRARRSLSAIAAPRAGRPPGAAQAPRPPRPARRVPAAAAQARRAALARGACSRCAQGQPMPALPAAGAATLAADADPRGAALAYRRARSSVDPDRPRRPAGKPCPQGALGRRRRPGRRRARDVGRPRRRGARATDGAKSASPAPGDAWRWRGRRAARGRIAASRPSHAFAELAKLKRRQVRIDRFLYFIRLVKSRTLAQAVIDDGHVRIDGKRVEKPSEEVRVGSVVALPLARPRCGCFGCSPARNVAAPPPKPAPATRSWELTSRSPRHSEAAKGA